ncbi:MAG: tRNA epoxyqueuosine(34) reductase QueG [Bryobacterales bacterium]|nr:tRNA epoxyqueuosine(34) reductase QueG [Bryobacterales bacterium]
MPPSLQASKLKSLARQAGFELAGIAAAEPLADRLWFDGWVRRGMAGRMSYLTDHRAALRMDPRSLLPSARSLLCVGKVYNGPQPYSTSRTPRELGWISRYAWGDDYHRIVRLGLESVARQIEGVEHRICVDTAPLLERGYARMAGLGWIGRNTCLINQNLGSWVFLGEMLLSAGLEPDAPAPDRCGTCRRCIDACPTGALVSGPLGWELDSRLCISYFTIELHGPIEEQHRARMGWHVFGCDICQDVCPWNRRAALTTEPAFSPRFESPPLEQLASVTEKEFREMFRGSPVERARYRGFLRNVAVAMGNSGLRRFQEPLRRLARSTDDVVAGHALWALRQLQ